MVTTASVLLSLDASVWSQTEVLRQIDVFSSKRGCCEGGVNVPLKGCIGASRDTHKQTDNGCATMARRLLGRVTSFDQFLGCGQLSWNLDK